MNADLFFIPILADAFRQPNPATALREAITRIESQEHVPQYLLGYLQFLRFVAAGVSKGGADEQPAIVSAALRMLLRRIAEHPSDVQPGHNSRVSGRTGELDGVALTIEMMNTIAERGRSLAIHIMRDGALVAALPLPLGSPSIVRRLVPGLYTISLDTGRVLWEGTLSSRDLLWHQAFRGRPFRLAAESEARALDATRRIPLRVGKLSVVVYPGVETGTMWLVDSGS